MSQGNDLTENLSWWLHGEHVSQAMAQPWFFICALVICIFLIAPKLKHLYPSHLGTPRIQHVLNLKTALQLSLPTGLIAFSYQMAVHGFFEFHLPLYFIFLLSLSGLCWMFAAITYFRYGQSLLKTFGVASLFFTLAIASLISAFLPFQFFQYALLVPFSVWVGAVAILLTAIFSVVFILHHDLRYFRGTLPALCWLAGGLSVFQWFNSISFPSVNTSLSLDVLNAAFLLPTLFALLIVSQLTRLFSLNAQVQSVQRSLNAHHHFFQNYPESILILNQAGDVLWSNPAVALLLNTDPQKVVDANAIRVSETGDDYGHFIHLKEFYQQVMRDDPQGSWQVQLRCVDESHKVVCIQTAAALNLKDHTAQEIILVLSDQTKQHHLMQSLQDATKQYRHLLGNLPCAAYRARLGGNGQFVFLSDVIKRLTGFSSTLLTSENSGFHFYDRIHPNDLHKYLEMKSQAANHLGEYECRFRFLSKNDEELWLWEVGTCYQGDDGCFWGDGFLYDVTATEHASVQLNNQLKISQKNRENQYVFLASMHTAIRSSMNSILGLSQVMLSEEKNAEKHQHLSVIQSASEQLLKLSNDIYDSSKIDAQQLGLSESPFFPHQLMSQFEFEYQSEFDATQIPLKTFFDSNLAAQYQGDVKRLNQLLKQGAAKMLDRVSEGFLCLHFSRWQNQVRFAFSLHGAFQCEFSENDFDIPSKKLSQLTQLMQGAWFYEICDLEHQLLYIDVPLMALTPEPSSMHANFRHKPAKPLRVQLLDTSTYQQQAFKTLALNAGLNFVPYASNILTQQFIEQGEIDVIFLDVYDTRDDLPSCQQLRQWQRQSQEHPLQLVALILSAEQSPSSAWQLMGFDSCLQKPFEQGVFEQFIENIGDELTLEYLPIDAVVQSTDLFDSTWVCEQWSDLHVYAESFYCFWQACQLNQDDHLSWREMIHQSAEVAAQANALGLFYLGRMIEEDALSSFESLAMNSNAMFAQTLNDSLNQVFAFLGGRDSEVKMQVDGLQLTEFESRLEHLCHSLAQGRFDEHFVYESLLCSAHFLPPALLHALQKHLNEFEFDAALLLLEKLRLQRQANNPSIVGGGNV